MRQLKKDAAAAGFAGMVKDHVPIDSRSKETQRPVRHTRSVKPVPCKALCYDTDKYTWYWVKDIDEAHDVIQKDRLEYPPKDLHDMVDGPPAPKYLYRNNRTNAWKWGTVRHDAPIVTACTVTTPAVRDVLCRGACGWHWSSVAVADESVQEAAVTTPPKVTVDVKTEVPTRHTEPRSPKRKCKSPPHGTPKSKLKTSLCHDPRRDNVKVPESQECPQTEESVPPSVYMSSSHTDVSGDEHALANGTDDEKYGVGCHYPTITDAGTPTSAESTVDSSTSCGSRPVRSIPQFLTYPIAGTRAVHVPKGFTTPILFDITHEMRGAKPLMKWCTANSYYHFEFLHAVEVLTPLFKKLPGGEYFWKKLRNSVVPKSWTNPGQGFPPYHPERKNGKRSLMKRFGLRLRCDHYRISGCPVEMTIQREYLRDKTRDVYSVQFSKGHHLMACNHLANTNPETLIRVPALHPVVDMWIRDKVAANTDTRVPYVLSDLEESLKKHLLTVTALHCELPIAGPNYIFGSDRSKAQNKLCCHQMTYAHVAKLASFKRAQAMPPTEMVPDRVGYSKEPYEATCRDYTTINHFLVKDGHSINGNHKFGPDQVRQMKVCLASYNKQLRGDHDISDSTTEASGVEPVHACFRDQNLFVRWEKMRSRDPKVHLNLRLFEWNLIGLLYRKRTTDQINAANTGGVSEESSTEKGDYPDVTDPRNLPYEFVAVYASLYSLMCGVKAWACRKVLGRVQITADNMYNCLKGVPNMYWFNVGVHDAKNIVFPLVNALQLGRAAPRNEVRPFM